MVNLKEPYQGEILMLSLKLVRTITNDRRAQHIGDAIGYTNKRAGIEYLQCAHRRIQIERDALVAANVVTQPNKEDSWIVQSYISYYRSKDRKKKAA